MARHILRDVSLALLVLIGVAFAEDFSNTALTAGQSPFQSDLGYQFFEIGSELRNVSTSTRMSYDDSQCQSDIEAIRNGLRNYDEWAIECKHN